MKNAFVRIKQTFVCSLYKCLLEVLHMAQKAASDAANAAYDAMFGSILDIGTIGRWVDTFIKKNGIKGVKKQPKTQAEMEEDEDIRTWVSETYTLNIEGVAFDTLAVFRSEMRHYDALGQNWADEAIIRARRPKKDENDKNDIETRTYNSQKTLNSALQYFLTPPKTQPVGNIWAHIEALTRVAEQLAEEK